jgi:hypothetical protein
MIDRPEFWKIMDEARHKAAKGTDIPDCLAGILKQKPVADLLEFEKQMVQFFVNAYDARLWVAAELAMDGCGDDSFMDFRHWLIAQGKLAYEKALENPDSLVELNWTNGDGGNPLLFYLSSVPAKIYREKTGLSEMPVDYSKCHHPQLQLANKEFMNYDAAKLSIAFPKLFAKQEERRCKLPKSEPVFPPIG